MPIYSIHYAFDCPCYGSRDVEANSPEDAERMAKELHKTDQLIVGKLDAEPSAGTESHRVCSITDENDDEVVGWFDLDFVHKNKIDNAAECD